MGGTSLFFSLGDCDDGEVGGMNGFGRGNPNTLRKLVHHKSPLPDS
jgi:hypothetical protein